MADRKLQMKIYKLENIDKIVENNRQYKLNNYEKLHEPFICECGSIYTYNHKARHLKTKKHRKFISETIISQLKPTFEQV